MKFNNFSDLKNDLNHLFNKFNLLNLWSDSIKIMNWNLNFFLKNTGKNFFNKLKELLLKYDISINNVVFFLTKENWVLKVKLSNKKKIVINLKYKIWDFQIEKDKKIFILNRSFNDELKRLERLKKYLLNSNLNKVLIFPILNDSHPLFYISELIRKNCNNFQYNQLNTHLNLKELLILLKIADRNKINEFCNFLYITENRLITKLENEIIPFIQNIGFINFRNNILEMYYYDSPDFILINKYKEAIGVEVTNIKFKKFYYNNQCYKETLVRNIIKPDCFYSKNFFLHKQHKKFSLNDVKTNNTNYKTEYLNRHFENNDKYNNSIRQNGLRVKRGQKNYYILNGFNTNENFYEKKIIQKIAIKNNIPSKRLIFFKLNKND